MRREACLPAYVWELRRYGNTRLKTEDENENENDNAAGFDTAKEGLNLGVLSLSYSDVPVVHEYMHARLLYIQTNKEKVHIQVAWACAGVHWAARARN